MYISFLSNVCIRYVASFGGPYHVDAMKSGNESRFINHSCEPNCSMNIIIRKQTNEMAIGILSMNWIQPWDEITIDYTWTTSADKEQFLECKCGSKRCRKNMYAIVDPQSNSLKKTLKPKGNQARGERTTFGPEGIYLCIFLQVTFLYRVQELPNFGRKVHFSQKLQTYHCGCWFLSSQCWGPCGTIL